MAPGWMAWGSRASAHCSLQPPSRLGLVSQAHRREGSAPPAGQQTAALYGSREADRQAGRCGQGKAPRWRIVWAASGGCRDNGLGPGGKHGVTVGWVRVPGGGGSGRLAGRARRCPAATSGSGKRGELCSLGWFASAGMRRAGAGIDEKEDQRASRKQQVRSQRSLRVWEWRSSRRGVRVCVCARAGARSEPEAARVEGLELGPGQRVLGCEAGRGRERVWSRPGWRGCCVGRAKRWACQEWDSNPRLQGRLRPERSALDRSAILTAGVGASPLAWLGRGANAGVLGRHGARLAAVWVRKGRDTRGGPGGARPAASPPPPPPPPARLPSLSHPHPQLPAGPVQRRRPLPCSPPRLPRPHPRPRPRPRPRSPACRLGPFLPARCPPGRRERGSARWEY